MEELEFQYLLGAITEAAEDAGMLSDPTPEERVGLEKMILNGVLHEWGWDTNPPQRGVPVKKSRD